MITAAAVLIGTTKGVLVHWCCFFYIDSLFNISYAVIANRHKNLKITNFYFIIFIFISVHVHISQLILIKVLKDSHCMCH